MTYRTKAQTIEAYHFTGDPAMDIGIPEWLRQKIEKREIVYDSTGILWIYPHRNVISLQRAHIGDYITYDAAADEAWVEWRTDFESKYEAV